VARDIVAGGGRAVADTSDVVTDAAAVVGTAVEAFGRVDIVINNAGILSRGPFESMGLDQLRQAFDVHLVGSFSVTQAAWPQLRASRGRVLCTASSAVWGISGSIPYAIAKSAMIGLVYTLALEGEPDGIRVNGVLPIASTRMIVGTPGNSAVSIADLLADHFDPRSVAGFVAWLLHRQSRITGELFAVGGGHAGRVFIGETGGYTAGSDEPESWVGSESALLDTREVRLARSASDSLGFTSLALGGAAAAKYAELFPRGPVERTGA
jgi:NAD(P)-dependent dehydrogenase (short-subunit alcohol dehydrogenase family)